MSITQDLFEREIGIATELIESLARQACHTDDQKLTDSGAITAHADALEWLAERKRFRIIRGFGRMVLGYWPEDDPEKEATK